MDMDSDIVNWIIEFLLRLPLEDRTLNSLLRSLPLPNENLNLQKSLLLKKLESEPVSENTLRLLEQLEEIEFRRGNPAVSDALKTAYCAVAVECTSKVLTPPPGYDGGNHRELGFSEMVERVWSDRIGRMEKCVDEGGLGSMPLWAWKEEIEEAVWDDRVWMTVAKKIEGVCADKTVKAYVREEREKMGPSFLELVGENVMSDDGLRKIMGVYGIDGAAGDETPPRRVNKAASGSNAGKSKGKGKGGASGSNAGKSKGKGKELLSLGSGSAELNEAREALESSLLELRAVMEEDPVPESLRVAKAIRASLMQGNSSARTFEWDDSVDGSPEDRTSKAAALQLHSPKRMNTLTLKKNKINNLKKRRRPRKWSEEEEKALKEGVDRFGIGNWKPILNDKDYRDKFDNRTEVDLKDKWRNLSRWR